MIFYLCGIVVGLCVLHILLNYNKRARMLKKIPGPKKDFLVGDALTLLRTPVELMKMMRDFANSHDGIYHVWSYPIGVVVIYNHEDIEKILSNMKYIEKSIIYKFLKPWLRDGLLLSNAAKWQERRKILTPTFHFNILKQFFDLILKNCDRFVENLKDISGKPVDVVPILSEFTLNSICETAMGIQLNEHITELGKSYKQAVYDLGLQVAIRISRWAYYSDFIFSLTSRGRQEKKTLNIVHNFTESVIKERKEYMEKNGSNINAVFNDDDSYVYKKKKKTAMLDLLLSAEKEGLIDEIGVQEEVDTFILGGHDTTASGLTFCLLLLANHRKVQEKIQEELYDIYGETKRPIDMEDLNKMKYMDCCIKESLRMYPPVHLIGRTLNEDTVLSGYTVPANTQCNISIFDLHYREEIFKNPKQFNPDRFLPENSEGRPTYAYIPFSAGPRNCIGQKFAMMEMKIAVAMVLQHFDLAPVTRPKDIRFTADLVLRNNGPVLVNFIRREK